MTICKKIMLIAAISMAPFLSYKYFTAEPAGYCNAQKRNIPDDEFIQTAVALYEWQFTMDLKHYPSGKISSRKDDHKDQYQNWVRSKSQPDCCSIYRGATESPFTRLFELKKVEVTLFPDPEHRGDNQIRFSFDTCGKLLPHEFGFQPGTGYEFTTSNYQKLITTNSK